jgi:hypothetical protein
MSSTTPTHHSTTNSRRNSDKPHVSIDIGKHTDGLQSNGHYPNEQRLSVDDGTDDESKNKKDGKINSVSFLGFDLEPYSISTQFFVLSCGIFFFYLVYGIAMEQIFRIPGMN